MNNFSAKGNKKRKKKIENFSVSSSKKQIGLWFDLIFDSIKLTKKWNNIFQKNHHFFSVVVVDDFQSFRLFFPSIEQLNLQQKKTFFFVEIITVNDDFFSSKKNWPNQWMMIILWIPHRETKGLWNEEKQTNKQIFQWPNQSINQIGFFFFLFFLEIWKRYLCVCLFDDRWLKDTFEMIMWSSYLLFEKRDREREKVKTQTHTHTHLQSWSFTLMIFWSWCKINFGHAVLYMITFFVSFKVFIKIIINNNNDTMNFSRNQETFPKKKKFSHSNVCFERKKNSNVKISNVFFLFRMFSNVVANFHRIFFSFFCWFFNPISHLTWFKSVFCFVFVSIQVIYFRFLLLFVVAYSPVLTQLAYLWLNRFFFLVDKITELHLSLLNLVCEIINFFSFFQFIYVIRLKSFVNVFFLSKLSLFVNQQSNTMCVCVQFLFVSKYIKRFISPVYWI